MRRQFFGLAVNCVAGKLLLGVRRPTGGIRRELAALDDDLAGDQRLGLDLAPVGESAAPARNW